MRFHILPPTGSMFTQRTFESSWIDMLSLDVPLQHSFARKHTIISAVLIFAFVGTVIFVFTGEMCSDNVN